MTCLSSAQETAPSALLMSVWGMASRVPVDRRCACEGAVPPTPNSARLSGDLGPSPRHRSASSLPILGGMPLGTAGAALLAATCPATLGELGSGSSPGFVGTLA